MNKKVTNMEKDEMYVVNQPRKSIVSLVLFDENITDEIHENIIKLNEISDVIFIFSREYKRIDKNKLTSLYNGCAWIESYDNLGFTFFKVLDYCVQIFRMHNSFLLINMNNLVGIGDKFFDNIKSVNSSSITKPIFKLRQLSAGDYKQIYTRKEISEDSFLDKVRRFFGVYDELEEENEDNMFCSYTSDSVALVYFRPTILKMIEFNSENVYSELFDNMSDCRYLFASMTKYLNLDIIDCSIENLAIGKL